MPQTIAKAPSESVDAIVQLSGGFGNQLFQYAFGIQLAAAHNRRVAYDVEFYQRPQSVAHNRLHLIDAGFDVPLAPKRPLAYAYARRMKRLPPRSQQALFGMTYIKCPSSVYKPVVPPSGLTYYTGLWHSPDYFSAAEAQIHQTFRDTLLQAVCQSTAPVTLGPSPPQQAVVGFHVRRGDYLTHEPSENLDYAAYLSGSLERLTIELGEAPGTVIVFTDDPTWCAANLHAPGLQIRRGGSMLDDFLGLMHCRHKIISNSTFAWWAAFLGESDDGLVFAPNRWHTGANNKQAQILRRNWIEIQA